jgi:predicted RNA-binding Zn-ribbon protein involved in translation (DUF1610 family)
MKTSHVCPKCGSDRIGHLDQVADVADQSKLHPQHIASKTTSSWGGLLGTIEMVGKIEAYVCTQCGFYETYVCDAPKISFEDVDGFRWVKQGE